ncbi:TIR domain-containing protein [Psidium guajava]|nr:TIR domain-containing protein [Psidium guajava]
MANAILKGQSHSVHCIQIMCYLNFLMQRISGEQTILLPMTRVLSS